MHDLQDFEKGDVKQFRKACQWYETLGQRMAGSGHCLDVFACSLDQVGIAEMHDAISVTGEAASYLSLACSLDPVGIAAMHDAISVAGDKVIGHM